MATEGPIRVVVVDDSPYLRFALRRGLERQRDIQVVGLARDGLEAIGVVAETDPDVVTLDVEMPRLDGLATIERLMQETPRPIVMVSSLTVEGAETTIKALELGAVDFVPKPSRETGLDQLIEALVPKIRAASAARVRWQPRRKAAAPRQRAAYPPRSHPLPLDHFASLVVIGCSTGGPGALVEVLPKLDPALPAAYVVVQHMPPGFTRSLAQRLDQLTGLRVREAEREDQLHCGEALVAAGDWHLLVGPGGRVALSRGPRLHGVRPAVDVTLQAAAATYRDRTIAVILTGMGTDGADGCAAVKAAGGTVIAEDAATCVVDGMPRAVRERGLADTVVPLHEVAQAVSTCIRQREAQRTSRSG
ncbi:MAG TPA: chemotaxis response regulator protein-glutamate methylesterase, partial [Chloroflexota bacterium]